ncbi:MAG: diguanylate cyclase [Candidatus Competibacteraceae bacterium]|nr:diguanylate cyclase [Candidatus Competibacteraceae bacterium]
MKIVTHLFPKCSAWLRTPAGFCFGLSQIAFLVVLGLQIIGGLEPLELMAYDQGLRLLPDGPPDSRIVLIAETEADLQRWGYPLPDAVLADALQRLQWAGARAIGVDKFRDRMIPPGSESLAAATAPNVIWTMQFGAHVENRIAPPPFLNSLDQVGFGDFPVDPDGITRRALLFQDDGQTVYSSLALQLALRYLQPLDIAPEPDSSNPRLLRLGSTTIPQFKATTGGYRHADAAGYQYLLDFRGLTAPFATYTLSELLDSQVPETALRDRIVLIGAVAASLKDRLYIPTIGGATQDPAQRWAGADGISGVQLHALAVSQLLRFALGEARPIRSLSEILEGIWIWLCCLAGGWLGYRAHSLRRFIVEISGVLIGLIGLTLAALAVGWWLPLGAAALGLSSAAMLVTVQLRETVREQAVRDLLTGLLNRRYLDETLPRELRRCQRNGEPLVAAMLDVDHFKRFNDSYGHEAGDAVLRALGELLRCSFRGSDLACRYGGEELTVVMPGSSLNVAQVRLDELRQAVMQLRVLYQDNELPTITVSIGAAAAEPNETDAAALLGRADAALYQAKAQGRNRVMVASSPA